ncbi:MAG TPA: gamma-glutamyltransferase [Bryobacteraceae bacterium]|nr:gamma-glutamyltransferase [Bryobacteraceae bacterium]
MKSLAVLDLHAKRNCADYQSSRRLAACITWLLVLALASGNLYARQPVYARHAMVVAQEPHATDVGVAVLKAGGNAIDAAVAVGFALAVTHPTAGNIGGGGFMIVRLANGHTAFLDFREAAPGHASHDMYLDAKGNATRDSIAGWRAPGVPGTVRGLEYAHKKFGHKSWSELVDPAIKLATEGFPVPYTMAESLKPGSQSTKLLSEFADSKRIFLGHAFGDKLIQAELAATLTRIRNEGSHDFYEGETAHRLATAMKENGGLITLDDLKNYKVAEREPLTGKYRGYEIITSPPPSSGGIGLLQMLAMLEPTTYEKSGAGSAAEIHYVAEVERRFYADRSEYLGDPDFFKNPIKKLLEPAYVTSRRASIDLNHASTSDQIRPGNIGPHESTETTHYSVVDSDGNAVAVTYTLNGGYGSGVTAPGLGFLLNNEMDDFAAKPGSPNMFGLVQGEANAIQPGKRPLSSMTPTIVLHDGKLFMTIGAPGGSRIINGVLEVFQNVVDFHMNPQDADDWPRFHHQWQPDKLYVEPGVSPDTIALLKSMGHNVEVTNGGVARVEVIVAKDGMLEGATDGRGSAKAAGY